MQIDLLGGSFEAKYKALNAQRTINWFSVYGSTQERDKNQRALYPTPGATAFVNLPGRYFRCLFVAYAPTQTRCFAVVDTTLYEVSSHMTYTTIGTLTGLSYGTDNVYMTIDANSNLGIWHQSASFTFNLLTNTLTPILVNTNNNQFPGSVTHAIYLDTYQVIISGGIVWPSVAQSSNTWLSTQSFAPTWDASPAIALGTLRDVLYIFCGTNLVLYYNDGQTPYARQDRTPIPFGIVSKDTLATVSTGFFFLGKNIHGECEIYFYDGGFNCQPISTANIAWRINSLGYTPTDAYGWVEYNKDGQILYYLTIPGLQTTFVYNQVTQEFHERDSKLDNNDSNGDNVYAQFRAKTMVNFNGMHLYADIYSGTIFLQDATNTVFTENGNTVIRERYSQTFSEQQQLISVSSLELDCDPGILTNNATLQISLSKDGGMTFDAPFNMNLGPSADYDYRFRIFKLGSARRWVVHLALSDPADLIIQAAIAHGSVANS